VDTSFILSYSAGANGSLTGSTTQAVNFGTNGTAVTAIPDVGYHFTSWSDGVLTAERTDLNIAGDISVSASFSVNVDASYTLTYTAEANGTIVGTTPQTVQYGNNGSTVTASSSAGYHFVSWSDGVLTAERTDSNVQGNITVSASFAINVYTLSYVAGAHGSLTGSTTQAVNFGTNGTAVTATPDAGYHFTTWSDGVLTAERTDLNIVGDISVTASFAINTYILNYSAGANGSLTGSTTQTVNYGSSGTAVVAAPESSGYHFTAWSDGVLTASRTDTNVTANKTVSASFAPNSIVTVTSVATTSAYNIASVYLTSIVGTGFLDGATVKLTKTGQPDIACTSVVVDSSTLISNAYCHIVLATAGLWNVVVTNTDTGAGSLDNSFTVREYALRDVGPSGGLIFYINANYVADGWRYLEAAPSDQSTGRTWSNVSSLVGTTGTAAGTGPANTTAINAQSTNSAAGICDSLTVGSYTDWFLPSQDELSLMYTNLHLSGVGGFTASGYWSSSEVDATNAIRRTFSGVPNNPESKGKTTSYRVRAIRRFSVDPTYTVTYNGNENTGGTVPVDGTAYEFASAVIVEGVGSLVRNQDAFLGWNTTADGSGTRYLAGSTLTMGSSNVTLYAEWQSFTIAFLPDTQSYVKDKREVMTTQLDWLVANKTLKNIKFVSHEGDVVQNWENANTAEWEFVQAEMNKLTTASIPYSANPGNHDYAYMTRGNTSLNTYFPLSSFQSMATFSGSYDTNSDNTYHIIDMAGHSLLILSLEFGPRDAVMTWANNVLSTHPTIPAIIVTHAYMSPTNELLSSSGDKAPSNGYGLNPDVNDGTDMWTELVYPNNNVRFVICGHVGTATDGSGFIDSTHADGSHVYQILSNYQYYTNFPGYLLLLNFSSATVTLRTYSPYLSAFKTDPESQNDFSWSFE
jgi:hypothetical protein